MSGENTLLGLGQAERHRRVAGRFADVVGGVTDWEAPAPVSGWTARAVVEHLTTWFPGFLEAGTGLELPRHPSATDDPVAAWDAQSAAVQALLDDPAAAARQFEDRHTGALPLPDAIDRFYTSDVFMHTWDLARATGQDDTLDARMCAELLAGMEPIADVLYASGQYGPRVPVPDGSDAQTRLLGLIGRDPTWAPPT